MADELEQAIDETRLGLESIENESSGEEVTTESGDELSEIEQEAISHGWNPEGVEGKKNLSAEEFMDRQGLYDDIRGLKKQNRKLLDGMEAMKEFQNTIRVKERERVLNELKAAKKVALENENYDAVVQIDDRIAETKAQENPPTNTAFEKWIDDNDWYHQDTDMKQYADMIGTGYFQQNPNKSMDDVYLYVSDEVKKRFPDKFGNPKREQPNPVEGASKGRVKTSKKYSARDLPEHDREIMKTIVRSGAMTEAAYLKEYFS